LRGFKLHCQINGFSRSYLPGKRHQILSA
jgi:hypothetical protein